MAAGAASSATGAALSGQGTRGTLRSAAVGGVGGLAAAAASAGTRALLASGGEAGAAQGRASNATDPDGSTDAARRLADFQAASRTGVDKANRLARPARPKPKSFLGEAASAAIEGAAVSAVETAAEIGAERGLAALRAAARPAPTPPPARAKEPARNAPPRRPDEGFFAALAAKARREREANPFDLLGEPPGEFEDRPYKELSAGLRKAAQDAAFGRAPAWPAPRPQYARADTGIMTDAIYDADADAGTNADANEPGGRARTRQANDLPGEPYPAETDGAPSAARASRPHDDPGAAFGIAAEFRDAIADRESKGDYRAVNASPETGQELAWGKYQFTKSALRQIGLMNDVGDWTGAMGIRSKEDFLNDPELQELTLSRYMKAAERQVQSKNLPQYYGERIDGLRASIVVTEAGVMAAAHRQGAEMVKQYLEHVHRAGWTSRTGMSSMDTTDNFTEPGDYSLLTEENRRKALEIRRQKFLSIETRLREFQNVPYAARPKNEARR